MHKKKKLAIFGHKHIYTEEGGIEIVVTELAKRLCRKYDVTVIDRAEIDRPKKKYPLRGRPAIKLAPTLSNGKLNAIMSSFFATIIAAIGPYETVHVHAEGQCSFLKLLKLMGKRVVATVHGLDWQRGKWGKFASSVILFGEKQMVKYADEIIVLSEDMRRYFKETYGRDTIVISNGVTPHPDYGTDELEKLGIVPGEYFLYLGRIVPEKRLDLLVSAYEIARVRKKLVIAGDASKDEELKNAAAGNRDIILTGFVSGKLKDQLLTHCGLFVLPSDLEGQSVALLEAMSYGAPCLVSDIHENRETLGQFGDTFKAGSLQSLTEALERSEISVIRGGEELVRYMNEIHNWDTVAEQTEKVLFGGN